MAKEQLEKVDFDIIRYSNCWEDADILLKGLDLDSNSRVMSIASAGDNSFSLLSQNPELVIAFDISQVQLYLVELKKVAIQHFTRYEYMAFAGFVQSNDRLNQFNSIKNELGIQCRIYWEERVNEIETGVVHIGKFEKYFQLFKRDYLHKVHDQSIVDELLENKSSEDQLEFHDKKWHTDEWIEMYKFFFGDQMMGSHGRDPEFLKYVEGSVSDIILSQEVRHLRTINAQRNYFLYYILNNKFHPDYLPHYVRSENYDVIKKNLDKLVLHHGLLDSALVKYPNCTHLNLSDIFEYMDIDLFRAVASDILNNSADKVKIAYWNLMIPRYISDEFQSETMFLKDLSNNLTNEDLGYFYRAFIVDQKR